MPRPSHPSVGAELPRSAEPTVSADGNIAVGSQGQYVPTLTAASPDTPTRWWSKRPSDLDLSTLKVVSESHVMWTTSEPILVCLGLSVLELGPMYATDRRQTASSLNAPPLSKPRYTAERTVW